MKLPTRCGSLLSLCLATTAPGQSVGEPILVGVPSASGRVTRDTAIAAQIGVDTAFQRVVAAWIDSDASGGNGGLRVALTFDGFLTSPSVSTMAAQGCEWQPTNYLHPMAASSYTGDLWVGSAMFRTQNARSAFSAARMAASGTSFGTPVTFQCYSASSSGLLALLGQPRRGPGPRYGAGADVHHVQPLRLREPLRLQIPEQLVGTRSDDATGGTWGTYPVFDIERATAGPCDDLGLHLSPAVVPAGATARRLVCSYLSSQAVTDPARVFYSDNGGADWAGLPAPANAPIILDEYGFGTPLSIARPIAVPGVEFGMGPSTAVDPGSPYTVYVVFAGESEDDTGNSDLFVATGVVNPVTGELSFPPANITRLTDGALGEAAGTDQIMPAAVVDDYHGLNIVYYAVHGIVDGGVLLQAKYYRLGSADQALDLAPAFQVEEGTDLGVYLSITASQCMVYPLYMSAHETDFGVYTNRVNVCSSDADGNGLLRTADPAAFFSQFAAADPRADLNRDGQINAADAARFQEGLICGCGTPPMP